MWGLVVVLLGAAAYFGRGLGIDYGYNMADQAQTAQHYDEAENWIKWTNLFKPEKSTNLQKLSRIYRKQGKFDLFQETLDDARLNGLTEVQYQCETMMLQAQSGKANNLEDEYEFLINNVDDPREVFEAFINGYLLTAEANKAAHKIENWADIYKEDPRPIFLRGQVQKLLNRGDKAYEVFQEVLEIEPNFYHARMAVGNYEFETKKYDEALKRFEYCLKSKQFAADAHVKISQCYSQQGNIDDAIVELKKALEIDAKNYTALCELGKAEVLNGEYEDAKSHLETALEIRNDEPTVHYNYGTALRSLGDAKKGMVHLTYSGNSQKALSKAFDLSRAITTGKGKYEDKIEIIQILMKYGPTKDVGIWLQSAMDEKPEDPRLRIFQLQLNERRNRGGRVSIGS